MMKNRCTAAVLSAGCLWGFMGLFRRLLEAQGASSAATIVLRCGLAALCFAVTLAFTGPGQFKIRLRDLWCFIGTGLFSLLFFTYCYFEAMARMSLSAAAILLYTAPAIVTLLSALLFHERLTGSKLAAVCLAFAGCALVSGLGVEMELTLSGVLFGLGSGVGYALYSIFARFALGRGYSSNTINFYSCLLAALGAALIWGVRAPAQLLFSSWENALLCLGTGVVSCYLPYLLYTYGLTGLETGRASVMASVEPVVATLVGIVFFRESLTPADALGAALVLSAVVLLNVQVRRRKVN